MGRRGGRHCPWVARRKAGPSPWGCRQAKCQILAAPRALSRVCPPVPPAPECRHGRRCLARGPARHRSGVRPPGAYGALEASLPRLPLDHYRPQSEQRGGRLKDWPGITPRDLRYVALFRAAMTLAAIGIGWLQ